VTLGSRLAGRGAAMLCEALDRLDAGTAQRSPQDDALATHARKLEKEDGHIDWTLPAAAVHNRVRAFYAWPVCFSELPGHTGRRVRVLCTRVEEGQGRPGEILRIEPLGPVVATGEDAVLLAEVQPEGKCPMTGRDLVNGCRLKVGDRFGRPA
jgi:methionyl-tRNA formyltransferase